MEPEKGHGKTVGGGGGRVRIEKGDHSFRYLQIPLANDSATCMGCTKRRITGDKSLMMRRFIVLEWINTVNSVPFANAD